MRLAFLAKFQNISEARIFKMLLNCIAEVIYSK